MTKAMPQQAMQLHPQTSVICRYSCIILEAMQAGKLSLRYNATTGSAAAEHIRSLRFH